MLFINICHRHWLFSARGFPREFPSSHSGTSCIAVPLPLGCPALRSPRNARGVFGCTLRFRPREIPIYKQKIALKAIFICIYAKIIVSLHPQFHAGDVCASSAGVADIFKRRLLTLCSDVMKCRSFKVSSELSNDRCPTGYRLSSLCLLVLVHLLRVCVCAHAYLNYVAREYIYIRRGLRVVSSKIQGNATAS